MTAVDDFLEHYGTKGMKWGVRKNIQKRSGAERSAYVKAKDAKWVDKVNANPKISKVARIAARDAKKQTKRLKEDYKARGLNIKKNSLDRTRYDSELKNILQSSVDRASYKVHKTSPTGLKEVQIHRHPDGSMSATIGTRDNVKIRSQQRKIARADTRRAKAEAKAVKHAADDIPTAEDFDGLEFRFVLDSDGFVDDILTPFDDEVEHMDDFDDALAHYGVKGMRWGVRRDQSSRAASSSDAAEFHTLKAKIKANGLASLTNDELKTFNTRLELEAKYKKAFPKKKNPVVEFFVKDILINEGKKQAIKLATNPSALNSVLGTAGKHAKR